ncbi:MAG: glycosyltransferase [Actinobacteria bacterium]|nr:glycosyltransferase [Actinomycetota bacterium]
MRVQVLLSTYNGERRLADQLDSVLAQTHADLVVTARDDGSTDATPEILAAYARREPRVQWSAGENLGVAGSFLQLLSTATGDLVAFCDQDDVWEQDHVERGVSALAARARPALWFSNLLVTDAGLRPIGRHDLVRPGGASFTNALVENGAFGCATLLNGLAVELLRAPLPRHVVLHDEWCYLVVSALGEVVYDPSPTVQHRQHGDNAVDVGRGRQSRWWRRVRKAWSADYVASYCRQVAELRRLHADRLPDDVRRELDALLAPGAAARLRYALTGESHRQHRAETVGVRVLDALRRSQTRQGG